MSLRSLRTYIAVHLIDAIGLVFALAVILVTFLGMAAIGSAFLVLWLFSIGKDPYLRDRPNLPCFNVHALIRADRTSERSNTFYKKVYKTISDTLSHERYRWLIVEKWGEKGFWTIDMWAGTAIPMFPYVEPMFVAGPFKTVDQAIGATILGC